MKSEEGSAVKDDVSRHVIKYLVSNERKKKKRRPQVIERVSRTVFKGVLSSEFIAFTPRSVLLKNRPVIFILGRVASMIVHQPDK